MIRNALIVLSLLTTTAHGITDKELNEVVTVSIWIAIMLLMQIKSCGATWIDTPLRSGWVDP